MNNDFELCRGRIVDVCYSVDSFTDRQCYIQNLDIELEDGDDDELIQLKLIQNYFEKGLLVEGDEVYLLYHDGSVVDIRKI